MSLFARKIDLREHLDAQAYKNLIVILITVINKALLFVPVSREHLVKIVNKLNEHKKISEEELNDILKCLYGLMNLFGDDNNDADITKACRELIPILERI